MGIVTKGCPECGDRMEKGALVVHLELKHGIKS